MAKPFNPVVTKLVALAASMNPPGPLTKEEALLILDVIDAARAIEIRGKGSLQEQQLSDALTAFFGTEERA